MMNIESSDVSLKRRVLGASSWSLAGFGLSYVIRLGSSLLMTRLLVPQMFGVMAIAMMVMTGLTMFSDVGLSQNIIQSKRGADPAYLNTAWTIQILRGLILWLLAIFISLLVFVANHAGIVPKASAYADPSLPFAISIVSISAVIAGFQSTKVSEASRRLSLGRITQIQIVAQVVGLICMIIWALFDRSIWALMAGSICSTSATTLLSHLWLQGVANRWQWDQSAFYEIIHFGKWIFLSSILGFLVNNADRILLGGLIDSAMLGIYVIAFNIFSAILGVLYKIIGDVSFSAFSEVARDRPHHLKQNYYKMHIAIGSFAYFCSGILMLSGHDLISVLYDRRYEQAGWILDVLAVALLPIPFGLVGYCLLALGLPKLFTRLTAIAAVGTIVFILLGFHFFGTPGAIWGIAASYFAGLPAIVYYQTKYRLFELSKELLLLPSLCIGMILGKGISYLFGH